jgi:hypothetical protein
MVRDNFGTYLIGMRHLNFGAQGAVKDIRVREYQDWNLSLAVRRSAQIRKGQSPPAITSHASPDREARRQGTQTMNTKSVLAALLVVSSLAISAGAQARSNESSARPQAYETGREVAAPSWSAACMSDQGPRQCGEPMWVYGSPATVSRYHSAF